MNRIKFTLVAACLTVACSSDDNNASNNANNENNSNNSNNQNNVNNENNSNNVNNQTDMGDDTGDVIPDPPFADCSLTVWPQDTPDETYGVVQTALLDAQPGNVVCFVDGQYDLEQEISLAIENVELRGESEDGVILDFSNQTLGANGISVTSDGFKIATMTIQNSPGDGIRVTGADGVTFENITVTWSSGSQSDNGAYGIYPVQCQNVLIDGTTVSYASDAGIYVGQSQNIIVRNSEAFGNVAGIEIENSSFADVHDNHAHDNTGGILIFDLPGPPVQGGRENKIHNNLIENNNTPNFADPANIVALVPTGTGVLILSSDANEIHNNIIRGNESFGVAAVSYQTTGQAFDNPAFDPWTESNHVHDNEFDANGTAPKAFIALIAGAAGVDEMEDMLWDGLVDTEKDNTNGNLTNCFENNTVTGGGDATYRMTDGLGGANQSTDLGANSCTGLVLPRTELP